MARGFSAICLWGSAERRRNNILQECIFYGVGMGLLGVVLTMLVATGTFPTSHEAMLAAGMLAVYLDAYMMCALAGGCVYLAARLARSALRKGGTTTVAKLVLVFGGIALMTSIALTVVAFVKQEAVPDHQPQTPAWVLAIQSLLLALCLLFLSVLTTAFYTLVETDRDAAVACVVGGGTLPVVGMPICRPDDCPHLPTHLPLSTITSGTSHHTNLNSKRSAAAAAALAAEAAAADDCQRPLAGAGTGDCTSQPLSSADGDKSASLAF